MKDFDVYKWNNKRRLAAVNESEERESEKQSVQPSIMYKIYDGIIAEMGDTFKAEFPSATDFERRMRKYTAQVSEGAMDRDQIAQGEFGMDYGQLGPGEKEWVDDEYEKDTHFK